MTSHNIGQYGLANVGNSCFLNSTVQCLVGTDGLRDYFTEKYELSKNIVMDKFQLDLQTDKKIKNFKTESKKKLTIYWNKLLHNLWNGSNDPNSHNVVNPIPFYKQLAIVAEESKKELAFNGTQNDFQEFLILLLEALHDSLSRETIMVITGSDKNEMDKIDRISYENYILHFEKDMSIFIELFVGQIYTKIMGVECGHVSERCDPIQFFPLVVPASSKQVSLEYLLHDYSSETLLDNDEKWHCDKCNQKVKAISKISIWRLPPYLILSLGRYQYVPRLHKRNTMINYPLEDLDMSQFYSGFESNSLKYNLYAVGLHIGNPMGGHYIAFRKNPDGNWYNFNDQSVNQISPDVVVNPGAYCLFYKRSDI
jgi:ubiquitin C-terminal hydrolase